MTYKIWFGTACAHRCFDLRALIRKVGGRSDWSCANPHMLGIYFEPICSNNNDKYVSCPDSILPVLVACYTFHLYCLLTFLHCVQFTKHPSPLSTKLHVSTSQINISVKCIHDVSSDYLFVDYCSWSFTLSCCLMMMSLNNEVCKCQVLVSFVKGSSSGFYMDSVWLQKDKYFIKWRFIVKWLTQHSFWSL